MKFTTVVLNTLLGVALAGTVHAQTGVARVNGVAIPQMRMDLFVKELVSQGRPDSPDLRKAVREELISRELMAQEAVRRGLDKNPEAVSRLDLARVNIMVQLYLQEIVRATPVTDDVLKKEYERIKAEIGGREYKARHILVDKEEEAKDILALLKKGSNFEKVAAERSKDTGSKGGGGDLDWGPPSRYVKPFADALVKLKKGQTTDAPVQSPFGWHIIRLDDTRDTKFPTFDEVKPNLQQQMQRQAQEKALEALRAKAKIE
jgi:peptidyl-prolyl cis-trans isomerase C